jgi:N-acetyl-D-muramate 6-phosphate phosphatase
VIGTVFFDLDGTLADTAPDLAGALNELLVEKGQQPLDLAMIRPVVSHGGNAMLQLAFNIKTTDPDFISLHDRFLDIYHARLHNSSTLFTGMDKVLATLEQEQLTWGVITNKPAWLTGPLMQQLGIAQRAACIVSGDSTNHRKPHPAPMQLAIELTRTKPSACLYIGDAKRDIEAGHAAGMVTLIARYGYIGDDENPESWEANGVVNSPSEIMDWIHDFNCHS